MIRVAVLDDHPLVLASLEGLLRDTADLEPVIAVADGRQLWRQLDDARPGVVVLDYDLARSDGLTFCQRLKERVRPPAVVIYSAYAGPGLALCARIAGADALVDKRAPAGELLDAIRAAAAGESRIPDTASDVREAAIAQLASSDAKRLVSRVRRSRDGRRVRDRTRAATRACCGAAHSHDVLGGAVVALSSTVDRRPPRGCRRDRLSHRLKRRRLEAPLDVVCSRGARSADHLSHLVPAWVSRARGAAHRAVDAALHPWFVQPHA